MKLPYRIIRPPASLRRTRLDNIALVPASMLFKKQYKAVARRLPTGSVLLCSANKQKTNQVLEQVAVYFRSHGHQVTTIPAARIAV